jgi:peptidoglycan/xylan/chitin deacetylase (PgdA/CDA1 family)
MLLADLCDMTGATELLFALQRRTRPSRLPVLTFHRVLAAGPDYAFDDGVVDTDPLSFERQLAVIREHFSPVTLADVRSFLDADRPLPRNPVMITFDDGYLDNLHVALPLLRRHRVPATFFIATDYVTHRRVFWWDRIAHVVKSSRARTIALDYPWPVVLDVSSGASRAVTIRSLLRTVKRTVGLDLERFLDEVTRAAGVAWSAQRERRLADELLMSWDQIRTLEREGMAVQSHTRTHRILQTLTPESLVDELAGSRDDLERELGHRIDTISYPAGHVIGDRDDLRAALLAAGYTLGFTNTTGAQPVRGAYIDRLNFCRMGVDAHLPGPLFRAMLAMPTVFD